MTSEHTQIFVTFSDRENSLFKLPYFPLTTYQPKDRVREMKMKIDTIGENSKLCRTETTDST